MYVNLIVVKMLESIFFAQRVVGPWNSLPGVLILRVYTDLDIVYSK